MKGTIQDITLTLAVRLVYFLQGTIDIGMPLPRMTFGFACAGVVVLAGKGERESTSEQLEGRAV